MLICLQAFACFSNALSMDPRNPDTLLAAAALYKSCGLLPEASRSLELALQERPDDSEIKQTLAMVLTDLGASSCCSSSQRMPVKTFSLMWTIKRTHAGCGFLEEHDAMHNIVSDGGYCVEVYVQD